MRRIEQLERLVVRLLIDQHRGEAKPCQVAEILRRRVLDHPLQLRLGVLQVVALEIELRREERAHRRVQRARIALDQRARGIAQRLCVARLRRLAERVVEHARLRRLAVLVPAPALPSHDRHRHGDHHREYPVAVLGPPRLQLGDLLLLF